MRCSTSPRRRQQAAADGNGKPRVWTGNLDRPLLLIKYVIKSKNGGSGGGGLSEQTQGDQKWRRPKKLPQNFSGLPRRTAFNIAPEKAEALASEVFGTNDWELRPSRTEANFYAVVEDRAIYLSFAGLASLWCLTFVAYNVMDHSSRAARQPELKAQQTDFGALWTKLNLSAYLDYARRLNRADEPWPADLAQSVADAASDSIEGPISSSVP
jgi:hypothetical protein